MIVLALQNESAPLICDLIIPAYNEEKAIAKVIDEVPKDLVRNIIVVDNNSTDQTAAVVKSKNAILLFEKQRGYGRVCLNAMHWIQTQEPLPEVVVFMDGDYSDYPNELNMLLEPIKKGTDLVIGSRVRGDLAPGSLTPQQIFGNALACFLMKLFYRVNYSDLGPFRAIRWSVLMSLGMEDKTYGWTVEMQVKAAKKGISYAEVPVSYRKRIGISKVSGTIKGTILAGYKILWVIFKNVLK